MLLEVSKKQINFIQFFFLMTDQKVPISSQAQPIYSSGIGHLPSGQFGINSGLSGKVNTNVGGVIVNPSSNVPIVPVTTVPYSTAINGPYAYQNSGVIGGGPQQIRQAVSTKGQNQIYQQKNRQSRGPNSGAYEKKMLPNYTNTPNAYGAYGAMSAYVPPPLNNSIVPPMIRTTIPASTPIISRNINESRPPVYAPVHQTQPKKCPKALIIIIGILGLTGIILGLLFGLGAIGGKNMVKPPTKTNAIYKKADNKDIALQETYEPHYSSNTLTVDTTIVNSNPRAPTTETSAQNPNLKWNNDDTTTITYQGRKLQNSGQIPITRVTKTHIPSTSVSTSSQIPYSVQPTVVQPIHA